MPSPAPESHIPSVSEYFYSLLYNDCPEQRHMFLTSKKPASLTAVLKNKKILGLMGKNEPGPRVDYHGLRINLAQLEPNIRHKAGLELLKFFRNLLQIRAKWLVAAVKFETFSAFTNALYQYYVVNRQEMLASFDYNNKAHVDYEHECNTFFSSGMERKIDKQFHTLREAYVLACHALVEIKTSERMWRNSGILWEAVQTYEKSLRLKKEAERIKKERAAKAKERDALKVRNAEMQGRQMGMQMVSEMDEVMGETLLGWMKEQLDGQREVKVGSLSPK